ncbi:MAG TPA: hypothetical protein VHW24_18910 [Bryobacteraceae bacterium]|nr:hypothetical protein [Bryobacteraceae bacterium]
MATPPIVPPILHLAARPFSFYPAIAGFTHNEWRLRKHSWHDWLVVNSRTHEEVFIPSRFLGEISSTDHPVLIVGLLRELRCLDGIAVPFERRVIEMPLAAGAEATPQLVRLHSGPAPVIGIRLEPRRSNRIFKLVGGALALAIFIYVATSNLIRTAAARRGASHSARPVVNPRRAATPAG